MTTGLRAAVEVEVEVGTLTVEAEPGRRCGRWRAPGPTYRTVLGCSLVVEAVRGRSHRSTCSCNGCARTGRCGGGAARLGALRRGGVVRRVRLGRREFQADRCGFPMIPARVGAGVASILDATVEGIVVREPHPYRGVAWRIGSRSGAGEGIAPGSRSGAPGSARGCGAPGCTGWPAGIAAGMAVVVARSMRLSPRDDCCGRDMRGGDADQADEDAGQLGRREAAGDEQDAKCEKCGEGESDYGEHVRPFPVWPGSGAIRGGLLPTDEPGERDISRRGGPTWRPPRKPGQPASCRQ